MIPTLGRLVHFVLTSGRNAGQHRPAIVVRVHEAKPKESSQLNLQVFTDGENDELPNVLHVERITRDEKAGANTWHEPEEAVAARKSAAAAAAKLNPARR
jgi:hypothetical protein